MGKKNLKRWLPDRKRKKGGKSFAPVLHFFDEKVVSTAAGFRSFFLGKGSPAFSSPSRACQLAPQRRAALAGLGSLK